MNIQDALNILGISAEQANNPQERKKAYRKAAQAYHPDRNSAGHEMMQLINVALETIENCKGEIKNSPKNFNYSEQVNVALNAIIGLGLNIEICGAWIWLSGDTKPHKELLKKAGFKWAPNKRKWHLRPEDYKCRPHAAWSMQKIYEKYGRDVIEDYQPALPSA